MQRNSFPSTGKPTKLLGRETPFPVTVLAGRFLWQQGCAGTRIQGDRNRNLPFCSDVIQFSKLDIARANRLGQTNGCVCSPDKLPVTMEKHKPGLTEQNCPGIPHWAERILSVLPTALLVTQPLCRITVESQGKEIFSCLCPIGARSSS